MSGPWLPDRGVRSLEKYVVPDEERLVFVVRRHWITLAEPVVTTVASGALMVALAWGLAERFADAANLLFLLWLLVVARAVYRVVDWRESWFGATQRRLMLVQGLVTRKVAMMPLEKVTDMSYSRSPFGQVLGYGEFVLESAGQDQALRSVTFIPNPDELYRLLVATMFGRKAAMRNLAAARQAEESAPSAPAEPSVEAGVGPGQPQERPFSWQERIDGLLGGANDPTQANPPRRSDD